MACRSSCLTLTGVRGLAGGVWPGHRGVDAGVQRLRRRHRHTPRPPRPAPIAPARLLVPAPPPRVKARQPASPDHSMVRAPEITRDVRRCGMSALRARDGRGECAPPRPCQVLLRGDGGVWFRWRLVMLTRRAASGPLGCPGRVRLQDRRGGRLGETPPIRRSAGAVSRAGLAVCGDAAAHAYSLDKAMKMIEEAE